MTGAVVVGDGMGAGSGASVMGPSALTEAQTAALDGGETVARRESSGSTSTAGGWIGGGIAGLALGAGLALVWGRRGRNTSPAG
jgi:hypothetical protein